MAAGEGTLSVRCDMQAVGGGAAADGGVSLIKIRFGRRSYMCVRKKCAWPWEFRQNAASQNMGMRGRGAAYGRQGEIKVSEGGRERASMGWDCEQDQAWVSHESLSLAGGLSLILSTPCQAMPQFHANSIYPCTVAAWLTLDLGWVT